MTRIASNFHVSAGRRASRARRLSDDRARLAIIAVLISGALGVGIALGAINPAGCAGAGANSANRSAPIASAPSDNASAPSDNTTIPYFPQSGFAYRTAVFDDLHWTCAACRTGSGPMKEVDMSSERNAVNPVAPQPAIMAHGTSPDPRRIDTTRVRRVGPAAALEKLEDRQLMSAVLSGPTTPDGTTLAPPASFALQSTSDQPGQLQQSALQTQSNTVLSGGSSAGTTTLPAQTGPLNVTFNANGLSGITYNNSKLFDGTANPGDGFQVWLYDVINPDGTMTEAWGGFAKSRTWDPATLTTTWSYDWGTVSCKYTVLSDRLGMQVTFNNTSATTTIGGINLYPVALRFPNPPSVAPAVAFGGRGPAAEAVDFGTGTVAMVSDDKPSPMYIGFIDSGQLSITANRYLARFGTAATNSSPGSWPVFNSPLRPHSSSTYNLSLRFAAAHTPVQTIAADAFQRFADAYPMTLSWTDRRPIGELYPSGSGPLSRTATNPNGWFNDGNVNVTTPAGLAAFRTRLLAYADTSIAVLKQDNAQGMITWDMEGEQYPNATYIGDPRLATRLAPELNYQNVVDAYFKKFTDAGLRVGLTIRPTEVKFNQNGPYQAPSDDVAQTLINKIKYAQTRWGCTLFYVDSTDITMDGVVFKNIMDACPGVLLIPETQNYKDYAYTAPYDEVRQGITSTPADVRAAYPHSFTVIQTMAATNIAAVIPQLIDAVAGGDILLVAGWYSVPGDKTVNNIYTAAAAKITAAKVSAATQPASSPPTTQSSSATPSSTGAPSASLSTSMSLLPASADLVIAAPSTSTAFSDTVISGSDSNQEIWLAAA
jgi:hypothetical protein